MTLLEFIVEVEGSFRSRKTRHKHKILKGYAGAGGFSGF